MLSDEQFLVSSAGQGNAAMVAHLITQGVNINYIDALGRTALHAALTQGHADVVKVLLNLGADPNIKRRDGWSCLEIAKYKENASELQSLLREAGAK